MSAYLLASLACLTGGFTVGFWVGMHWPRPQSGWTQEEIDRILAANRGWDDDGNTRDDP